MRATGYILLISWIIGACQSPRKTSQNESPSPEVLYNLNHALTEAVVQDAFSPPVAARIYAYTSVTAQLAVSIYSESKFRYAAKLNGFNKLPEFDVKNTDRTLVLVHAFNTVGKSLVYRDHVLDSMSVNLLEYSNQLPDEVRINSEQLAENIANYVLDRVNSDNYAETRNMGRYVPIQGEDKWVPTPPGYTDALEPHWAIINPFTLDSAAQFFEPISFEYSTKKGSEFYEVIAKQVYDSVNNTNDTYRMIAKFWDCNPFLTKQHGHLMYNVRQLTPGGHWMGIAEIVGIQEELTLSESADLCASVSIAMADAFIVAWHAKYETNFIRPETYINRYMDPEWKPILESPHFPEYTSAHSTVSAAAAFVLTDYFGEGYSFIDSTEVPFGLPARKFNSFFEASDEASISRVLGGIHFQPAIEMGMKQGRDVGAHALRRLGC